jgi:hypothetical protein
MEDIEMPVTFRAHVLILAKIDDFGGRGPSSLFGRLANWNFRLFLCFPTSVTLGL